jgi:diguanylate cyclase (GGDEF)-like protein/PAS domain S-box-containing protein
VLLWWQRPGWPVTAQDRFGCLVLTVAIGLLAAAVFFDLIFVTAGLAGLPYVLMPFLIWGTLRFTPREAAVWVSLVAVLATVGTLSGRGPFQLQSEINSVASIGFMIVAFSVSVLLTGAVVQERRRAAEALGAANAALEERVAQRTAELEHELAERRETEDLLEVMRFAVDHSSVLFFLIDPQGRFHYVNDEAVHLTGYDRETLLGLSILDLRPDFGPDDWARHWQRIRAGRVGPYETELRARDGSHVPVEVTPHYIELGGQEYDFAFVQDIRERKEAQRQLAHFAAHDPLTGALNRRAWFERAREEIGRAGRSGRPVAVLMLDLDDFKPINDRHGHDTGDRVLVHCVETCRALMRDYDVMGRFGGEEFVVLAPDTDRRDALALAERLCRAVEGSAPEAGSGAPLRLTVSVGVAVWEPGEKSVEPVIRRADQALYAAKRAGRNRVSG